MSMITLESTEVPLCCHWLSMIAQICKIILTHHELMIHCFNPKGKIKPNSNLNHCNLCLNIKARMGRSNSQHQEMFLLFLEELNDFEIINTTEKVGVYTLETHEGRIRKFMIFRDLP